MADLRENHYSNFPQEWWTEVRKRDYYIDGEGLVQLRGDSETGRRFAESLRGKLASATNSSISEPSLIPVERDGREFARAFQVLIQEYQGSVPLTQQVALISGILAMIAASSDRDLENFFLLIKDNFDNGVKEYRERFSGSQSRN